MKTTIATRLPVCLALASAALGAALASCSDAAEAPRVSSYGGAGGVGGGSAGTISIDPGGASAAGAGGVAPDAGCAYASVKGELLPTNILFVVDRSGSMNCNLPPITTSAACESAPARADTAQPSKWLVVTGALEDAFSRLPPRASVGLSFFNNNDDCGVSSQPSVGVKVLEQPQISALTSALDSVPAPKGGTPIIGATILAYKHLHQQVQAPGNRFVVVLTDGMESCDASKLSVLQTEVPKALSVNIRTFVIGAPGSEPARALLSQIAWMGGTARRPDCDHGGATPESGDCHVDMTNSHDFGADLAASLASITGQALTCEFDVPQNADGKPLDPTKVNVHYTKGDGSGVDILQDTTKACDGGAQGWQYNADRTKIFLCGNVCSEVKADTGGKIDIVLGCRTIVIPA